MKGAITWREPRSRFEKPAPQRCHLMIASPVTAEGERDAFPVASLIGAAAAARGRPVLIAELRPGRPRGAGIYSTSHSRAVAGMVKGRFPELNPVTRGPICHLSLPPRPEESRDVLAELPEILPDAGLCLLVAGPAELRRLVDEGAARADSVLLQCDLKEERALTALACEDLSRRGLRCRVWRKPLEGMRARLAATLSIADRETAAAIERLLDGLGLGREDGGVA